MSQAIGTGLLGLIYVLCFVYSTRRHGTWRTSYGVSLGLAVLLCVGLTAAELGGVVFVGPGGHGANGAISIP